MASAELRKELECSVCQNIYTDPVTLKCGHSFCRVCIDRVLDTQEESGDYACPICRKRSISRPSLQSNITLRNIVENLLSNNQNQIEIGICCTKCFHLYVPAVKSCTNCHVSLCEDHMRVHSKSPEHVLLDPTTYLENRKCSVHNKILEYYCTEDASCICVSCSFAGEHQGHQVETLDEAFIKKKERLRDALQKLMTEREETEKRVQSLQEPWRKVQEKAAREKEKVTALFIDLRRELEVLEKRVLNEISRRAGCVSLSDLIQQLEIKKEELSRKMSHIEEICHMSDPLSFLRESQNVDLCDTEEGGNEDRQRHDEQLHDGGGMDEAGITHTLHTGLADIIKGVTGRVYLPAPADISLDIDTVHEKLYLWDNWKAVTWESKNMNRPENSERFSKAYQVLSRESFSSGRHYWDVDVSDTNTWTVGMCYPSIERKERDESWIGENKESWGLYKANNQYGVKHKGYEKQLAAGISSDEVRVELDYKAGLISFYELSDPIRHLHTYTARFTEPLHAALYVWRGCLMIS
ncbi:tripartite motif-containing protein 14-like [Gastrophryne carolinensis]